jgi:hypothetical protein
MSNIDILGRILYPWVLTAWTTVKTGLMSHKSLKQGYRSAGSFNAGLFWPKEMG